MASNQFLGLRVLITGGSSGIGLALAKQCAQRGAHVCLAARDKSRLSQAVEEVRSVARTAEQVVCSVTMDVTSKQAVAQAIPEVLRQLGDLDLLVNNAGYAFPGYIDELDANARQEMLAVNYLGPAQIIETLLPHFIARGKGHIINVTSMLGFMGTFGYSAYAASKYALSGYTECLRQDLLPFGVRVQLCYPPTTQTAGLARENEFKPPEAAAIEGTSREFSADQVALAIVRGMMRKRFHILVGWDSWFIWIAQRFAPWLVRWVTDRTLRQELKRRGGHHRARATLGT